MDFDEPYRRRWEKLLFDDEEILLFVCPGIESHLFKRKKKNNFKVQRTLRGDERVSWTISSLNASKFV